MLTTILLSIYRNLSAHKLRTILALLGIVWGAYAVFMLLAIGQGIYNKNHTALMSLSQPAVVVVLKKTTKAYAGHAAGVQLQIPMFDLMQFPKLVTGIRGVSPFAKHDATLRAETSLLESSISGVSDAYRKMYPVEHEGREITLADVAQHRRVIFLGANPKIDLFHSDNPIGKTVMVNGLPFKVVGFAKPRKGKFFAWHQSAIPYTTFMLMTNQHKVKMFHVWLNEGVNFDKFKAHFVGFLAHRYHFNPKDNSALQLWDLGELSQTFNGIFLAIRIFLGFCGFMTLIVGAIGVANLMYLMVKERTFDIGLSMAVGAPPVRLLAEFLLETILLVIIGGFIAWGMTVFSIGFIQHTAFTEKFGVPYLSHGIILGVWALLLLTAIFSGFFPAKKAALLDPVVALRRG